MLGRLSKSGSVGSIALLSLFLASSVAAQGTAGAEPPLGIRPATGTITIDGDLDDAGWAGAAEISTFYETMPADNEVAKIPTVVHIAFDERYLYLGIRCDDPDPSKIRAPFVERDHVIGTDDNLAISLDPRNDRRSAIELRVNPRGIQGDASWNDANSNEDFAPDFFFDTAAKITATGWNAEFRIPFSSLRYPDRDIQEWGILVWRNYPRDYRYAFQSVKIPRGSPCYICHMSAIRFEGADGQAATLPEAGHLTAAPYATAALSESRDLSVANSDFERGDTDSEFGLDLKWTPTASSVIDATINPDFSQIETDTAQIAVNERFALFFPEKRPFFLEGVDLFDTPIQAVYTRTLTSPRWGLRGTGKVGASSYTLLVSEDRGGGLVVLPGAESSDFALQDFRSKVAIGRLRRDFGASFAGLLATAREGEKSQGGGHNRVFGPDFQWRPNGVDTISGQLLWSDTQNPLRLDLSSSFDGSSETSHAAQLAWGHAASARDWTVRLRDFGAGFRADDGFVPQNDFREVSFDVGIRKYPNGFFRFIRPYVYTQLQYDHDGDRLYRDSALATFFQGKKNLNASVAFHEEEIRVQGRLLDQRYLNLFGQFDPSRRVSRVGFSSTVGQGIDFAGSRVGDQLSLSLFATLRPWERLQLDLNADRRVLDVNRDVNRDGVSLRSGRLFTARVERLKATYGFTNRSFVRVIAQRTLTEQDPLVAGRPVPRRSGDFSGSALYSFKLNWQTVLFAGYGEERALVERGGFETRNRSLFLKLSYALQR